MFKLGHNRLVGLFIAIAILIVAQVGWWAIVFLGNVDTIERLEGETARLHAQLNPGAPPIEIKDASRRRMMFLSESSFFVFLTLLGLFLLYRALKIEARSRQIQKNFIEIITHESVTPITAIQLRLESLIEQLPKNEKEKRREATLALEELRRLSSVIQKTQNLNRLERQQLQRDTFSLSDLANEVLHRLQPLIRDKKVTVETQLNPTATIKGDPFFVQNLLQSLIENALLYNNAHQRKLAVSVDHRKPRVELRIADNGPGIDPNDQRHLYERFYRGSTSRGIPGTGLGLYIAKAIVDAHQGTIHTFETKGGGTTFAVELPSAG